MPTTGEKKEKTTVEASKYIPSIDNSSNVSSSAFHETVSCMYRDFYSISYFICVSNIQDILDFYKLKTLTENEFNVINNAFSYLCFL